MPAQQMLDGCLASAAAQGKFIRAHLQQLQSHKAHRAPPGLDATLNRILDETVGTATSPEEQRARQEMLAAFRVMFTSRLTVVNGRAGTGKTTLIRALVHSPEIDGGKVLLLAPTGKARVQLQNRVGREAFTLAQFLTRLERYDPAAGYLTSRDKPRVGVETVVVDEASMLTEDMLAALLNAVEVTDRLVLVGDPRQLPPIGAGRPFVDLERTYRLAQPAWPGTAPHRTAPGGADHGAAPTRPGP